MGDLPDERELPAWLSANQTSSPPAARRSASRWLAVGLTLAVYHPTQFVSRGFDVWLPEPSEGWWPFLINISMGDAGGYKADDMWARRATRTMPGSARPDGADSDTGREQHPSVGLLRQRQAERARRRRSRPPSWRLDHPYQRHLPRQLPRGGGKNGVFNFPDNGTHNWAYWGRELQAMKPDLQRVLGATPSS